MRDGDLEAERLAREKLGLLGFEVLHRPLFALIVFRAESFETFDPQPARTSVVSRLWQLWPLKIRHVLLAPCNAKWRSYWTGLNCLGYSRLGRVGPVNNRRDWMKRRVSGA